MNSDSEISWSIANRDLVTARWAIESGIEYARMSLSEHDASLGRTTIKNKSWAAQMEKDIRLMQEALAGLPIP